MGKAIAIIGKNQQHLLSGAQIGGCVELYIWHDGEFPFNEDNKKQPAHIHICEPEQFVNMGKLLNKWNEEQVIN